MEAEPKDPGPDASKEVRHAHRMALDAWRKKHYPVPEHNSFNPLDDNFGGRSTVRGPVSGESNH